MNTNIIRNAAFAALVTTASAVSAHGADYEPFVRAEATFTDSGYGNTLPDGFEFGAALTAGVLVDSRHEISLTTGLTKWEGTAFGPVGVGRVSYDSEQIPLFLNYRYHFEAAKRLKVFIGPTVGFIHEKATGNVILNTGVLGLKPEGRYTDDAFKFAVGGTIGASYALESGWELVAAAQVIRVGSEEYELAGSITRDTYDSAARVGFSIGVGYRW